MFHPILKFCLALVLLCGHLASSHAQTSLRGYTMGKDELFADRLPSGDILLNSVRRSGGASQFYWAQIDTQGTVTHALERAYNGTWVINGSANLVDGRQVMVGTTTNGGNYVPHTLVRDGLHLDTTYVYPTNYGEFTGAVGLPDSGFIAFGFRSTTGSRYIAVAARLDKSNDTVWTMAYDAGSTNFAFLAGLYMPNGNLLLGGTVIDVGQNLGDLMIASLSPAGELNWVRRYRSNTNLNIQEMKFDGQSRIYLGVESQATLGDDPIAGLICADTLGQLLWGKLLNGYAASSVEGVTLRPDGAPMVFGWYEVPGSPAINAYAATFDTAGNLQSSTGYDAQGAEMAKEFLWEAGSAPVLVVKDGLSPYPVQLLPTNAQGELEPSSCGRIQPVFTDMPIVFSPLNYTPVRKQGLGYGRHNSFNTAPNITMSVLCGASSVLDAATPRAALVPHPLRTEGRLLLSDLPDLLGPQELELLVADLQGRRVALDIRPETGGFLLRRDGLHAGLYSYQVLQGGQRIASGKLWIAD